MNNSSMAGTPALEPQPLRSARPPRAQPPRRQRRPRTGFAPAPQYTQQQSQLPVIPPYIPPFRQRRLERAHSGLMEPASLDAQRKAWIAMVKKVHGAINRVTVDSVGEACKALFRVNLVRARGVFCKTLLRAQFGSPTFSDVFAAVVAVVNSRMPGVGALFIARLVEQLREAYETQDRELCFATARFVACLYKQQVVEELLVLEFLWACLVDPTDGSVELAVGTLKECAGVLSEKAPKACESVFQKLRELLHDGRIGRKAQAMIEGIMGLRKRRFEGTDTLPRKLDLLENEDIITHLASLDDENRSDLQRECDSFQFDQKFLENEEEYDEIRKDILGTEYNAVMIADPSNSPVHNENATRKQPTQHETEKRVDAKPKDLTESDLVDFRRFVYLIFTSGISYEEWAHKALRFMRKHSGKEMELCRMLIETCSHEKSFDRNYGLLGHRLCMINKTYVACFEDSFATHYATIHMFDVRKIRNIARLFASLLASDALSWDVLQVVQLVREETTSSSRTFLKYIFKDMAATLGKASMSERLKLDTLPPSLRGVFPNDTAPHAAYSINFFNNIGLEYLTSDLSTQVQYLPQENQATQGDEYFSSSSSSTISSTLSASSEEGYVPKRDRSIGSKRTGEQDSLSAADRPAKIRRRSYEQQESRSHR